MSPFEEFTNIKREIDEISQTKGLQDYHAFIYWFIHNLYDFQDEFILRSICDKTHDKGIDACLIDDVERTITIIQSKYEREGNARLLNENEVRLFASTDAFFDSSDAFEGAISKANSKTQELLRRAWNKFKRESYRIDGIFITTHRENKNVDDLLDTTIKPKNFDLKVFDFEDILAFYHDSERNFLPLARSYDLKYVGQEQTFKNGSTKSWVCTVKTDEITNFVSSYEDDSVLFRKNVRDFLGKTETNDGIISTLKDPFESSNFWFYNNGITILCRNAKHDYDNKIIRLEDPQIINGCQTAKSINNFSGSTNAEVLVRIISSNDYEFMQHVVLYQNSSNPIKKRDLKSNDPIQIRLHRELLKKGFYLDIKRGDDYAKACDRNPTLKNLCKGQYFTNTELAKVIVAMKMNPALSVGQGEDYYFGEIYDKIFTNDLSTDECLGMFAIDWLITDELKWDTYKFHDIERGDSFKRPAHFIVDHLLYTSISMAKEWTHKFYEYYFGIKGESVKWDSFIAKMNEIVKSIYEVIYLDFAKYNSETGNEHLVYLKNSTNMNKMFESCNETFKKLKSEAHDAIYDVIFT